MFESMCDMCDVCVCVCRTHTQSLASLSVWKRKINLCNIERLAVLSLQLTDKSVLNVTHLCFCIHSLVTCSHTNKQLELLVSWLLHIYIHR